MVFLHLGKEQWNWSEFEVLFLKFCCLEVSSSSDYTNPKGTNLTCIGSKLLVYHLSQAA